MNPVAEILLEQVTCAQEIGKQILAISGLDSDGVAYAFATPDTLVIDCKDYATAWQFDEEQYKLQAAIAGIKSSIQTILIEKTGKPMYCW
ncbi:hypothetical protein V2H45_20630 [Tumidithrix elongata RA019]|uniref:Uncharacterized protein n=1 Tax=Tumidithrix elongata BACA0141 TaxID=2716417 RepID=A0AAW9Q6P9_9CYAN|nr:hypothetical protein [Tumidithrix elongata RA019]